MLRIKESEWQRFCDNAENLGFEKSDGLATFVEYRIEICACDSTLITEYVTNKIVFVTYGRHIIIDDKLMDILFNLIEQGYVEKVKE